jgi:hypothetical protein
MWTVTGYVVPFLVLVLLAPALLILTVGMVLRMLGVPQERIAAWALRMAGQCKEHGALKGRMRIPTWLTRPQLGGRGK